jgi:hypothetical protein
MVDTITGGIATLLRPAGRRREERRVVSRREGNVYSATAAPLNFIPDEEELAYEISRAIEAGRKGYNWDRGSILNVVA